MFPQELSPTASAWDDIRPALERLSKPYPHQAMQVAKASREQIAAHLLDLIEQLAADPTSALDFEYTLHLHAICLLAEFRETRAYRPLVRLAAQPDELGDKIFGDAQHSLLGRAIASVCDGDLTPILALAEDSAVSIWLRGAALDALVTRFLEAAEDTDQIPTLLLHIGGREAEKQRALPEDERNGMMLAIVVNNLCDIEPNHALSSIREWYGGDLVDESFVTLEDVESAAQRPLSELRARVHRRGMGYVRDAIEEMQDWACFDPENESEDDDLDYDAEGDLQAAFDSHWDPLPLPYVRKELKVGRNEPCPCGSGKKYKKCCGANL